MAEAYQASRRGPLWEFSDEGIRVVEPGKTIDVPWDDVARVVAGDCEVRIFLAAEGPTLVLGQRWTGGVPPSTFVAVAGARLPDRLRTGEFESALRCVWGWARSSELGGAKECPRCGGPSLTVVRESVLTGRFGEVEVVLRDVDRRVCRDCGAALPTDEEQIGVGDLLFGVAEAWERTAPDWEEGLTIPLRTRGFLSRQRGELHVRVVDGHPPKRPFPGDIHLAALNAMCDESPTF